MAGRTGRRLQQVSNGSPQPEGPVAQGVAQCPAGSPVNTSWVPASSIFDQLTADEISSVEPTDNFLFRIELFPPPKAEAVAFLGGVGPRPERFARAIVYRGADSPRHIMEYKVGPLPLNYSTAGIEELVDPGQIPFAKFPTSISTSAWTEAAVGPVALELRELFKNMTGGKCYSTTGPAEDDPSTELSNNSTEGSSAPDGGGCSNRDLSWLEYPDFHDTSPSRIAIIKWQFVPQRRNGEETYLHTLPVTWKLNETDPDPTMWPSYDFEYCNQGPFATAEDLLDALQAGDLKICSAPEFGDPVYDYSWATTDSNATKPGPGAQPGPREYSPSGPRFTVSPDAWAGRRFKWLGWEGHATIRPDTGLTLNDVAYKGKRIVYELAQQDMYVAYSGFGGAGQTIYFDSAYGMGYNNRPLVRGYDCPFDAHYMSSVLHYGSGSGAGVQHDVLCMFEDDMATTAWRHTHVSDSIAGPHADGARAVDFVVRAVSTIGNYDYIVETRFRQDASIEVRVTAAGYMSALYYDPAGQTFQEAPFGTRVHKYVLANIHDHLSGWKVDLDIEGRNNTLQVTEVKTGSYKDALAAIDPHAATPGWWTDLPLKYTHISTPDAETGFKIDLNRPQTFRIVNQNATNKWGSPRGYAIVHGATTSQLLPDWHPLTQAAAWTKYNVAVTQQHDEEYRAHASMYDMYNPAHPLVSLDHYLNGESVTNADLVNWVMVGLQHVPRSEDVPLIYNMAVNFFIKPWNYFDQLEAINAGAADGQVAAECMPAAAGEASYKWTL
ncbi:hypothetical protein N2152v2_008605 [Parachlorella kessleri]